MTHSQLATTFQGNGKTVVPGYVHNVHDAINFDIDLFFTPHQRSRYRHVITNQYKYKEEVSSEELKTGKVYRCRLKGIQISGNAHRKAHRPRDPYPKSSDREYHHRYRRAGVREGEATKDVNRCIDRSDGWVFCVVDSVDVYNRLLIDILDPKTNESLKDMLFFDYPDLFSEYVPHVSSRNKW